MFNKKKSKVNSVNVNVRKLDNGFLATLETNTKYYQSITHKELFACDEVDLAGILGDLYMEVCEITDKM